MVSSCFLTDPALGKTKYAPNRKILYIVLFLLSGGAGKSVFLKIYLHRQKSASGLM